MPNKICKEAGFSRCLMATPIRRADPIRVTAGARTFFVTSSICKKRNLLQSDRMAGLFLRVLYDYRAQNKFRVHEFVIMPDHFHLLLTVESEMTIARCAVHQGRVRFSGGEGVRDATASLAERIFRDTYCRSGGISAGTDLYPQ